MQTLQIDGKKAKKLFPTASPEFREMLLDSFGEKFFSEKITDRIKTFEDACEEINENPNDPNFSTGTPDEIAFKKIKVIVKALNPKDWITDWDNGNQRKWYPWFYMNQPGFRFDGADFAYSAAGTASGSRLCFFSEELATYAGKQFLDLYK